MKTRPNIGLIGERKFQMTSEHLIDFAGGGKSVRG
jgi:hypothetical protein